MLRIQFRVDSSLISINTVFCIAIVKMKRIKITRSPVRDRKLEREIMKQLKVNNEGMIVYPGKGSEDERTGSPVQFLIDWHLYRIDIKPLDYDIFVSQLK